MTSEVSDGVASAIASVICGATISTFQVAGRVVTPLSVRLLTPVKTCVPTPEPLAPKVTLLPTEKAPAEPRRVPVAIVSVPRPSGPARTVPAVGELSAPMRRAPAVTLTPPAKVLRPPSCSTPLPDLVIPPFWMTELTIKPGCHGARSLPLTSVAPTEIGKEAAPLRSRLPAPRVEAAAELTFIDVALRPVVRVSVPVGMSVGEVPPLLSKVSVVSVLAPASVTLVLPRTVAACEGMTPPASWTKVVPSKSIPPVPRRPVAPSCLKPGCMTVPPV